MPCFSPSWRVFSRFRFYYQTGVFLKPPNKVRTDLYENNRCLKDTLLYVARQNKRKKQCLNLPKRVHHLCQSNRNVHSSIVRHCKGFLPLRLQRSSTGSDNHQLTNTYRKKGQFYELCHKKSFIIILSRDGQGKIIRTKISQHLWKGGNWLECFWWR